MLRHGNHGWNSEPAKINMWTEAINYIKLYLVSIRGVEGGVFKISMYGLNFLIETLFLYNTIGNGVLEMHFNARPFFIFHLFQIKTV